MAIVPRVGRKALATRLLTGGIYAILIFGALTMVYPFALMLSTSITSDIDYQDFKTIPSYLFDDETLRVKYLYAKYDGDLNQLLSKYGLEFTRFEEVTGLPTFNLKDAHIKKKIKDWNDFKRALPSKYKSVFFVDRYRTGETQVLYHKYLKKKSNNEIKKFNLIHKESYEYFEDIDYPLEKGDDHKWRPVETTLKTSEAKLRKTWEDFKKTLPPRYLRVFTSSELYQPYLEKEFQDIKTLNEEFQTSYSHFRQIEFPLSEPSGKEGELWVRFIKEHYPLRFIELSGGDALYQSFLKEKYGSIERYNLMYDKGLSSFAQLKLSKTIPKEDLEFQDWSEFVDKRLPVKYIEVRAVEFFYQQFLKEKFANISSLNKAYATNYSTFSQVRLPFIEVDYFDFYNNQRKIKSGFILGNYVRVLKYIALKGRSLLNTFILVVGTVLGHLTILPLAAFALSRFKLPYAHRILLFLLATMAFPAEVAMIPNFLLMKELHLLNTYWALILPGLASGFGIFLLKGFFDSLPQELYEAAIVEGASELRMFWRITVPLSKPILAVIALGSFTSAYGGFMWAFLICQQERMWTLMVWLYQFQQTSAAPVVMASLVVAAIPTLLVFIFAQNVIMRGIIIPTFK